MYRVNQHGELPPRLVQRSPVLPGAVPPQARPGGRGPGAGAIRRAKTGTVVLMGLLLALWGGLAAGLSSDKDQPIELEADSVDLDEGKGVSVYRGNVQLQQGSLRLQADTVRVNFSGGQPTQVVAEGRPVRFEQLPDNSKQPVQGRARRAEYRIDSEELVLIGDANLSQGKDSFKSDRIVYDRVQAKIKAGAAAEGKERVKITIGSPRAGSE